MNVELRAELLAMAAADQAFRRRARHAATTESDIEDEHERAARTAALIHAHGWPGRSLVGDDGAGAAWLLIQHADHDVELQERCLDLLRVAVDRGEASPVDLAYLTDRVRVNRGRGQVFGTQFRGNGANLRPCPIEEPHRLDERRASVGLEPFAAYEVRMRREEALVGERRRR